MLQERRLTVLVPMPKENPGGKITERDVTTRLMKVLAQQKVLKEGYFQALTKVFKIGQIPDQEHLYPNHNTFCVRCRIRMLKPIPGEALTGIVHRVRNLGVFLRSGPMEMVYLSARKMPNYTFVPGGTTQSFVSEDLSRVEIGVVVRYSVMAAKWEDDDDVDGDDQKRGFRVLASIDGDGLGPVSTVSGLDGLDF